MTPKRNDEQRSGGSVSLRVPDFVGDDGTEYSEIEVVVEMESSGDIRDAVRLVDTLERPMKKLKSPGGTGGRT